MGGSLSRSSSSNDVADALRKLGAAYEQYATAIIENGIDGKALAICISSGSPSAILKVCEVSIEFHRLKLECELNELATVLKQPPSGEVNSLPLILISF